MALAVSLRITLLQRGQTLFRAPLAEMSVLGKLTGMSTPEKPSPSPFKVIEADLMAAGFTSFRDSTELMDELAGPNTGSGRTFAVLNQN